MERKFLKLLRGLNRATAYGGKEWFVLKDDEADYLFKTAIAYINSSGDHALKSLKLPPGKLRVGHPSITFRSSDGTGDETIHVGDP